jgi:hypothetical protein
MDRILQILGLAEPRLKKIYGCAAFNIAATTSPTFSIGTLTGLPQPVYLGQLM